jgi:hypothetical protein
MSLGSLKALRTLLGTCATFRTVTGTNTQPAAEARIALYNADPPLTAPCAVLWDVENVRDQLGAGSFYYSGRMGINMEFPRYPNPLSWGSQPTEYAYVKSLWDAIKDEMQALGYTPGNLSIASIDDQDAQDTEIKRADQRWFFEAEIVWPGGV